MKNFSAKVGFYQNSKRMPKGVSMKKLVKVACSAITMLSLVTLGFALAGCGGSGGGGVQSSQVVSGTAAVGSPMIGQVNIKDSSTPSKTKTTTIGSDGTFAFDVTDMKAPYVLQANGSLSGTNYTLYSYAEGTGIANVNPLSNMIVAGAAGVNDPSTVYTNMDPATLQKVGTNLSTTVADMQQKLQPLLALYGAGQTNPMTAPYTANHLGLDAMFDSVKITLSNGSFSIVNAQSNAVICTGQVTNIANGTFTNSNMPMMPTAPAAPVTITAVGGTGQVTLTWGAVSNATTYNVYYSATSGVSKTTGTKIASATSPYVQTGLAAGTTYYYVVTAVNSAGESAASTVASAATASSAPVPAAPAAPVGVTATGGTNQVTLSWSAVSGATSYNVYYSTVSGVTTSNGTKISNAVSPSVLASLAAGTTYYYVVTAVNSAGESVASTQVSAITLSATPAPTAPAAPTGVTATGGTTQVSVSWSAVSGATSYNIYYSTTSGVTKANGTKIAGVTSPYVQAGLTAGTTYYYIVTAVNSAGESAASAQASAATSASVPVIDGAALYSQYCAGCHGALGPRTAAQVTSAIASFGAMSQFRATGSTPLSAAQIAAIAASM
jgi:fibronectin type 3 domain-containing protein